MVTAVRLVHQLLQSQVASTTSCAGCCCRLVEQKEVTPEERQKAVPGIGIQRMHREWRIMFQNVVTWGRVQRSSICRPVGPKKHAEEVGREHRRQEAQKGRQPAEILPVWETSPWGLSSQCTHAHVLEWFILTEGREIERRGRERREREKRMRENEKNELRIKEIHKYHFIIILLLL